MRFWDQDITITTSFVISITVIITIIIAMITIAIIGSIISIGIFVIAITIAIVIIATMTSIVAVCDRTSLFHKHSGWRHTVIQQRMPQFMPSVAVLVQ